MIKNCIAYRVTPGFRFDPELLNRRPARECGAMESSTDGFVEPCDHSTAVLVHSVAGYQVICWQTEDKLLPGSVVQEVLAAKCDEIELANGYRPSRKMMKELKERVIEELLPRAFVQKRRTMAVLGGGYFIVDTSSAARAEGLMNALAHALGALPFKPVATKSSPTMAMAAWLQSSEPPELLTIDSDAVLELPTEEKPSVHYSRMDLGQHDVVQRVQDGYMPKKVGMTFDSKVSFMLNSNLQITRIAQLDLLTEAQRHEQAESAAEVFDGDVAIAAGELIRMLDYLVGEFGGLAEDERDLLNIDGAVDAARSLEKMAREEGGSVSISTGDGKTIATFGDGPDPLYDEAVAVVLKTERASISMVQRHLRIGYNRAARLIEAMENGGVISTMAADGSRKVLVAA